MKYFSGLPVHGVTTMNSDIHSSVLSYKQMSFLCKLARSRANLSSKTNLGFLARSYASSVAHKKPYLNRSASNDSYRKQKQSPRNSPSNYRGPSLLDLRKDTIANRALVYEYLRSTGIVPDELDGLELPVTVEIMRERVDFVSKLGLSIDDMNNYPLILGCSVKKNMIPVLDYLGKLGVRKSSLTDFLRRYPQVLHASVVVDLDPVIRYLKGMDIKPNDIPRVLERYPEVLGFKLEGTMSTSVAYLVGIGVCRREIGSVLTRYPEILGMRVARTIKPFAEYLMSLGLERIQVAGLIEKRPHILGFPLDDRVKANVSCLKEMKVREEAVASVVAEYPEILGMELRRKLEKQAAVLAQVIGLESGELGGIIEKMPQIATLSEGVVAKHVEFLGLCGLEMDQIRDMVKGCPQILALNLDVMKISFDYFAQEMNRPLHDLVAFPAFFTYSVESTIKPRHKRVSQKGLKCSLSWFLNCSDHQFHDRMEYDTIGIQEMDLVQSQHQ